MTQSKPVDITPFKHLFPFESRFIQINGFKYHYVDEGSGEPVVMVHGNPTWSFYFRELIRNLSPRFRTIAMDHIGCGLSDKPAVSDYDYRLRRRIEDLSAFLDRLNLNEKITLVMHDWGGVIGTAYALEHLDRIRRLIIFNTAAFFPPPGKRIPLRLQVFRNFRTFAKATVLGLNLFARGALFMAPAKRLPPDVRAGLIAPYNSRQNRIATLMFVRDIPVHVSDPSYPIVKQVDENLHVLRNIPLLICWGLKDFVFDAGYLAEWRKRFPNADVHAFADAGHYILEDCPEKIVDICLDFMFNN